MTTNDEAFSAPTDAYDNVSTGQLPDAGRVQALVDDTYARFRDTREGTVSDVYPALARADPDRFGVCVAGVNGRFYEAGDTQGPFAIMSVAKPFVFAIVCAALGAEEARRLIGVNATGMAFNSIAAVERSDTGATNPMVNSGAIATTSLVPGATTDDKWAALHRGLSGFAGRELTVDDEVYRSASETNSRNQALARFLDSRGAIFWNPADAVDLYTRECSLSVTARDLAVMGATLASGGVNPITGDRVVEPSTCHDVLAVMATAGLYETSGDWLFQVGLPGKSGIGGGIVTVSPGKGGLGVFSPPLDEAGNSVRGQLAARHLSRRLGLDLFVSAQPH